ncbi:MAG: hypothetical protein N2Z62_09775 [Rhodobacteraceae bacterium]|nr:hypothetical protein [Paracoccaceae bacterium]
MPTNDTPARQRGRETVSTQQQLQQDEDVMPRAPGAGAAATPQTRGEEPRRPTLRDWASI